MEQMTAETAERILKCAAIDMTGALTGLKQSNPIADVIKQRLKAIDLAIDALEKQVPKKPVRHGWTTPAGITLYEYNCNKCDESMEEEWKLCPYCGQAIDWTE